MNVSQIREGLTIYSSAILNEKVLSTTISICANSFILERVENLYNLKQS